MIDDENVYKWKDPKPQDVFIIQNYTLSHERAQDIQIPGGQSAEILSLGYYEDKLFFHALVDPLSPLRMLSIRLFEGKEPIPPNILRDFRFIVTLHNPDGVVHLFCNDAKVPK